MECESIPDRRKTTLSATEFQARLATALQTPDKMQVEVFVNEQGQLLFPAPSPVVQMGNVDLAGRLRPWSSNAAGEAQTEETNSAAINTSVGGVRTDIRNSSPLYWRADGVAATMQVPWLPITPITIAADGNGNPAAGAGVEIIPLNAGDQIDVAIWMTNNDAGTYIHRFREATAAPAAVIPPWLAVALPSPVSSTTPGNTWGHRMITTTVAENFGIGDGVNADWPNAASVTYTGLFRYI